MGRATSESRQYTEPYTDGLKYMTFTKTSFALGTGLLNWGRVIHLFKYFVARWQKEAPWHLNKFSLPLAISAAYVLCLISHFSILIFRRKKIFLEKSEDKIHNKIPGRKKNYSKYHPRLIFVFLQGLLSSQDFMKIRFRQIKYLQDLVLRLTSSSHFANPNSILSPQGNRSYCKAGLRQDNL